MNNKIKTKIRKVNRKNEYRQRYIAEYNEQLDAYRTKFGSEKKFRAIRKKGTTFYGVELELEKTGDCRREVSSGEISNNDIVECLTSAVNDEKFIISCKRDGSLVDGLEFVSNPISASAWTFFSHKIKKFLGRAKDFLTVRDSAGMHIHISMESFHDKNHIANFETFFGLNPNWVFIFSERKKPSNMDRWASLEDSEDIAASKTYIQKMHNQRLSEVSSNKYKAIRYTEKTLEVRIFSSTLNWVKFLGRIQAIDIIKTYTLLCNDKTKYTIDDLIAWATPIKNSWLKNTWRYGLQLLINTNKRYKTKKERNLRWGRTVLELLLTVKNRTAQEIYAKELELLESDINYRYSQKTVDEKIRQREQIRSTPIGGWANITTGPYPATFFDDILEPAIEIRGAA